MYQTLKVSIIILWLILGLIHSLTPVSAQMIAEASSSRPSATVSANLAPDERTIRVATIQAFLDHYNSPLASHAAHFVDEAEKYDIDWRLVAAIAGTESTFGKRVPYNSHNAWGWGIPTGASSGIGFDSWEEGISAVSKGLGEKYFINDSVTLRDVAHRYAASPHWHDKVSFFLRKIDETSPDERLTLSFTLTSR